jgi:hypothetical protein
VFGRPEVLTFTPTATKWLTFKNVVLAGPQSLIACAACGLLWAEVGVPELLEVIRESGTERAQAWLESSAEEPL